MHLRLVVALLLLFAASAGAGLEKYQFTDTAEENRFRALIAELRCMVCQNQSLADSDAELAEDLRREAYKLMKSGRSDAEVIQFLVDRYGDFVRYRPPLNVSTLPLWFGPLLLFAAAGVWAFRVVRNHQPTPEISEAQRREAERLLDQERE